MSLINRDYLSRPEGDDYTVAQILVEMSTYREPSALPKLPAEIALYIMETVESLSDLKSLILTAPLFNNLWRLHTVSISFAMLSRHIECFPEALRLEEAVYPRLSVGFGSVVARHERIVCAASFVSDMYELFREHFPQLSGGDYPYNVYNRRVPFLGKDLYNYFQRSFYWLWLLVVTANYKPFEFQTPLDPFLLEKDDILSLCELIIWAKSIPQRSSDSDKVFRKANRIYPRNDRKRCAQSRRWHICCTNVWYEPQFERIRRAHWLASIETSLLTSLGPSLHF